VIESLACPLGAEDTAPPVQARSAGRAQACVAGRSAPGNTAAYSSSYGPWAPVGRVARPYGGQGSSIRFLKPAGV